MPYAHVLGDEISSNAKIFRLYLTRFVSFLQGFTNGGGVRYRMPWVAPDRGEKQPDRDARNAGIVWVPDVAAA